ncbi:MAG: hypothetical protein IJK97_10590, partial [Thermoguttaceae bacterium]|nr:hypothetical protein [Thermoguttaceae bacterium]
GKVRTMVIDGQPYFVGKDVADVLGYRNSRDALNKHVEDEDKKSVAIRDGIGIRILIQEVKQRLNSITKRYRVLEILLKQS